MVKQPRPRPCVMETTACRVSPGCGSWWDGVLIGSLCFELGATEEGICTAVPSGTAASVLEGDWLSSVKKTHESLHI